MRPAESQTGVVASTCHSGSMGHWAEPRIARGLLALGLQLSLCVCDERVGETNGSSEQTKWTLAIAPTGGIGVTAATSTLCGSAENLGISIERAVPIGAFYATLDACSWIRDTGWSSLAQANCAQEGATHIMSPSEISVEAWFEYPLRGCRLQYRATYKSRYRSRREEDKPVAILDVRSFDSLWLHTRHSLGGGRTVLIPESQEPMTAAVLLEPTSSLGLLVSRFDLPIGFKPMAVGAGRVGNLTFVGRNEGFAARIGTVFVGPGRCGQLLLQPEYADAFAAGISADGELSFFAIRAPYSQARMKDDDHTVVHLLRMQRHNPPSAIDPIRVPGAAVYPMVSACTTSGDCIVLMAHSIANQPANLSAWLVRPQSKAPVSCAVGPQLSAAHDVRLESHDDGIRFIASSSDGSSLRGIWRAEHSVDMLGSGPCVIDSVRDERARR